MKGSLAAIAALSTLAALPAPRARPYGDPTPRASISAAERARRKAKKKAAAASRRAAQRKR